MRSVTRTTLFWALLAMLAGAPESLAQTTSASLAGTVRTEEGQPVADAVVTARSPSNGSVRTALTDRLGEYRFDLLNPGSWTVAARIASGKISDSRNVELQLQATVRLDFVVGQGLRERVTVTASTPLVDRRETAGSLRVGGETANTLPISGRVFTDLARLDSSVGAAAPGNYFGERGSVFVVNGQTGRSNSFLVDGLDNNDPISGTTSNSFYSQQVIQEFVLLTHQYAPEFGRASGGVLNIVTRRGSNDPTWEVFVQGSEADWNNSGDFVDRLPATTSQDAVNRFQGGLNVGGAFKKDRAFYFLAYEHQDNHDLIPYTGVTRNRVSGGRFVAPSDDDNLFVRTDFNLSPSQTLMVRLSADDRTSNGVNVGGVFTPDSGFSIEETDLALAASLTSIVSGNLLNEVRLLVADAQFDQFANSLASGVTRPSGIFGGNPLALQDRNETRFQLVENLTLQKGDHRLKFGLDLSRSETEIRTRFNPQGNFIYNSDAPFDASDCGNLQLSDFTDAVAEDTLPYVYCHTPAGADGLDSDGDGFADEPGVLSSYPLVYSYISGSPSADLHDTKVGVFAQDRWEIGERLILDYGLRYDVSSYTLPAGAVVDTPIPNGAAERDENDIAPRLGFTFSPKAGGKLVLRGGGGIFYDKLVLGFPAVASITSGTRINLIPFQGFLAEVTEDTIEQQGLKPLLADLNALSEVFEKFVLQFATAPELDTPYTVQFNLGMERAVGATHAIGVNVVRAQGYHQPLMLDFNPVDGLYPVQLQICNEQTNDPDLDYGLPCHLDDTTTGSIATITTQGRSWYTGVDLKWRWQTRTGWLRSSYTWSKSEDMGFDPLKGGISLPPNSRDLSGERGRSDGDRRHRFVVSGDFPLPWMDLRASAVLQLTSGLPFNVTTGRDDNVDGILNDRPDGVHRNTGADTDLGVINALRLAETEAAAADPMGAFVRLPRLDPVNSLDEPTFFQVDVRLYKPFGFQGDKGKGEIYFQVFNLFDRENVGLIEGRAISASFGEPITLAGPPLTLEIGVKLGH